MHKGIDVANNVGTPIVAAKSGRVVFSGWHDGGYGYLVTLAHADGSRSLYGHNSRLMVRVGQDVEQGSLISHMGSTGRSTGPHLHFEVHPPSSGAANPLQFLPPRA
jgi:murein DD-endopeptidase MepM/ murein hydrolase activator NlpD